MSFKSLSSCLCQGFTYMQQRLARGTWALGTGYHDHASVTFTLELLISKKLMCCPCPHNRTARGKAGELSRPQP